MEKRKISASVIAVTRDLSAMKEETKQIVDDIIFRNINTFFEIMQNNTNVSDEEKELLLQELRRVTDKEIEEALDKKCYASEMDKLGGKAAGVCYSDDGYEKVLTYDDKHVQKIIDRTKGSGHHSPYDHANVVFYLNGVPKLLAMILNNENQYATSEKSARYTEMDPSPSELEEYERWTSIYSNQINKYITGLNADDTHKKAIELARYAISCGTPTCMIYSTSYRQINIIYNMLEKIYYDDELMKTNPMLNMIRPQIMELMDALMETGYINNTLPDFKNRVSSLFVPDARANEEYIGDVYSANYQVSIACLAQLHRHRVLNYEASIPNDYGFYTPRIIRMDPSLINEWNKTMEKVAGVFPQGMYLDVNEQGSYRGFISKWNERRCTAAQAETFDITGDLAERMYQAYTDPNRKNGNHRNAADLQNRLGKLRCCPAGDFHCPKSCGKIAQFRGPEELIPEEFRDRHLQYRLI